MYDLKSFADPTRKHLLSNLMSKNMGLRMCEKREPSAAHAAHITHHAPHQEKIHFHIHFIVVSDQVKMMASNFTENLLNGEASPAAWRAKGFVPKKIVIVASGSRGEVQPFVALGLALKARGHEVTIATEERVKYVVDEFGLNYARLAGDPTGVLFEQNAQKVLKEGSVFQLMKLTEEWDKKFSKDEILESYVTACAGMDLIIGAVLTMTQTYCVAEMMNIPWIPIIHGPTFPTNEFPIWALAGIIPFSCLNKWSYNFLFKMLWTNEKKFIDPWRVKHLGRSDDVMLSFVSFIWYSHSTVL